MRKAQLLFLQSTIEYAFAAIMAATSLLLLTFFTDSQWHSSAASIVLVWTAISFVLFVTGVPAWILSFPPE